MTAPCVKISEKEAENLNHAKNILRLVKDLTVESTKNRRMDIDPDTITSLLCVIDDLLPNV